MITMTTFAVTTGALLGTSPLVMSALASSRTRTTANWSLAPLAALGSGLHGSTPGYVVAPTSDVPCTRVRAAASPAAVIRNGNPGDDRVTKQDRPPRGVPR
jgi:hypothetical protein